MGDPRVAAVPVEECGEGMVDVRDVDGLTVRLNEAKPDGAYAHLRQGVADRLLEAQGRLLAGCSLMLVEGHRPYALQEFYFNRHRSRLEAADPAQTSEESYLAVSQFVSPPAVAPHVSGAAIDLTLVDASGDPLDMGTPIDASPEESDGACYFGARNISVQARQNRAVLAAALESVGLVNYPTEWWHWSYGDRYWALMTGRHAAVYGPVADALAAELAAPGVTKALP